MQDFLLHDHKKTHLQDDLITYVYVLKFNVLLNIYIVMYVAKVCLFFILLLFKLNVFLGEYHSKYIRN